MRFFVFVFAITAASLVASAAQGGESTGFPMFGYDVQRTSSVPGKGVRQPVLKWSYQVPGSRVGGRNVGAGALVIGPDVVYVTTVPAAVIKLDRATGKELARAEIGTDTIVHRATSLAGDRVLLITQRKDRGASDGDLICLGADSLSVKWKVSLGCLPGKLLVVDGLAIIEGGQQGVHRVKAFLLADGKPAWEKSLPLEGEGFSPGEASPAADGKIIIRTCSGARDSGPGKLIALDTRTGKELWALDVVVRPTWGHAHSYAIAQGKLYCNNLAPNAETQRGGGAIIDLASGKIEKTFAIFPGDGAVTIGPRFLYTGGKGAGISLAAIDGEGKPPWGYGTVGGYTHNKFTLVDGVLHLSDWGTRRWALDANDGRVVYCFKPISPRGFAMSAEDHQNIVCDGQHFITTGEAVPWNWKGDRPCFVMCYDDLGVGDQPGKLAELAVAAKEPRVRAAALRALTALDAPRQCELALKLLADQDPLVRTEAAWTIYLQVLPLQWGSLSPWACPSRSELAKQANHDPAKVLAQKDTLFQAIRGRLNQPDNGDTDQMRDAMIRTLGEFKTDPAVKTYLEGLKGRSWKGTDAKDSLPSHALTEVLK